MTLCIDATNNIETHIKIDDREYTKVVSSPREQDVFGFLLECLSKEKIDIHKITSVEVNPGPGSFTGCRVGVSIGNALAWALGIKINGVNPPITPIYSSPPSITVPKPKPTV